MKIGFTTIYSWRPHVTQMYYLAQLARQAGHQAVFLACDGDLPTCNIRQMRPRRPSVVECAACRLGNIRTYDNESVSSIGALASSGPAAPAEAVDEWVASSASSLGRFETDADYESADFRRFKEALKPAAARTYAAARAWIGKEKLDGLFFFNGRMDTTRAVMEAANDAGIPFVSMERTWFGDGVQLFPQESCTGLANINRMVAAWSDRPLTCEQAWASASHIAARFLRHNHKEWRAYNVHGKKTAWPNRGAARRILLLPSSRYEFWGHADWRTGWRQITDAYDALIEHFGFQSRDLILRCHPNWGEPIGRLTGVLSENHYAGWAEKRGILCIPSTDSTSTMGLIEEAEAIVVAGGSAALEAGALGKQVIALSPSWYQKAGFQTTIYGTQDLDGQPLHADKPASERAALARHIQRQTLRYGYTVGYRVMQFVRFIRCLTTTNYGFFEGADPDRLVRMLQTGALEADDPAFAANDDEENQILELVNARAWEKLAVPVQNRELTRIPIHRRHLYQLVDWARAKIRRGDLSRW